MASAVDISLRLQRRSCVSVRSDPGCTVSPSGAAGKTTPRELASRLRDGEGAERAKTRLGWFTQVGFGWKRRVARVSAPPFRPDLSFLFSVSGWVRGRTGRPLSLPVRGWGRGGRGVGGIDLNLTDTIKSELASKIAAVGTKLGSQSCARVSNQKGLFCGRRVSRKAV